MMMMMMMMMKMMVVVMMVTVMRDGSPEREIQLEPLKMNLSRGIL